MSFVEKEESERGLDRAYLRLLIQEGLEFVEELSQNLITQELDELQDTLSLIGSLCPEDKKQALKVYSEGLDSILKNDDETKKLKTFLESII